MSKETKDRLALRMSPATRRRIEQWYEAAGCPSMNQFVEQAVKFYVDHLAMQDDKSLLPKSVSASLDGRLRMFEDHLAALLYKQAVELDMVTSILADSYELTAEDMRRRRTDSVHNVKRTNSRLSFEEKIYPKDRVGSEWRD